MSSLLVQPPAAPAIASSDALRPTVGRGAAAPDLRVLQVYRTYFPDPPGGLQEAMRQIAFSTRPHGVRTRVFTLSPDPAPAVLRRPEGDVVQRRSWAAPASCDLGGPDAFRAFAREVASADVVHYHFPWPFADVLHVATRVRRPALLTYHSDIVRQQAIGRLYGPLMRRMLGDMRAIVATSPAYLRSSPILSALPDDGRCRVIPLGIVERSYAQAVDEGRAVDLEARFGVRPGGYVVAVGVLRYYKGLHTLVDAAARCGVPTIVAGSGPEHDALQARIAARRAPVRLVGQVTDAEKCALIAGSLAVALPSHLRSEAFGVTLVEGAMLGRPLVSCEISTGTSYVNVDGETGFVVPPEDDAALAAAMTALRDDPALRERMGQGARRRYEREFSGEALGRAYAALYAELASAGRASAD